MARVIYSAQALDHLEKAIRYLIAENPIAALDAAAAIRSAVEHLRDHPLLGSRVNGEIRQLVISYGHTGYIALYRFVVQRDEVRVLAIRHQRELGYRP